MDRHFVVKGLIQYPKGMDIDSHDAKKAEVLKKQQDFERLLLKTPLEEYTKQLWESFALVACGILKFELKRMDIELYKEEKEIATLLLPFLCEYTLLRINDTKVENWHLSGKLESKIKDILIDEYKSRELNLRPLTEEEAEEELYNWRHNEFAKEFLIDWFGDGKDEGWDGDIESWIDGFSIDQVLIREYASSVDRYEEITFEQVKDKLEELEALTKSKQGRKVENLHIYWLILEIKRYYKEHRNKDFELFFDCMDLFGLLDDVKTHWLKTYDTPKKVRMAKIAYIKSAYKEASKHGESHYSRIVDKQLIRGDIWYIPPHLAEE